ncbi:uncharacterized protein EI97DRAFT_458912 [Westerdykella ornata]|uniref:EthD domain-containing protein n=1 Tax=Westerdykella ornata TaxID=318751 RepID=A0A6A6JI86_WESOR|nr:uncharacterized protein EI97DRAFT_458912 [Westerdykella ornata]KAF2275914.1 hypothetical protein EI97DRAFT_458912 [Westerdykella ornata]
MRLSTLTSLLLTGALPLTSALAAPKNHDYSSPICNLNKPISLTPDQETYLYNRTYAFKELAPPNPASEQCFNKQAHVRVIILFKRRPDISEDYFHLHWSTVHAELTVAARDFGIHISRYNQFHQTAPDKTLLAPLFAQGLQPAPYDGIAELYAPDMDDFQKFMNGVLRDEPTQKDIVRFVDVAAGLHVMAGYDDLVYGLAAPGMGGSDGIVPGDERLVYSDGGD